MTIALTLAAAIALGPLLAQSPDADARSATVSGRVVDAVTGRPIPGVIVTPAGSAATAPAGALPPRALTNGQGLFILRDLRKGTVFLGATKNGYVNATYNQRRPGGSGQGLPINDGQRITDVELRMWRNSSISGTVVDEAGDPVVGVRVQAFARFFVAGRKRYSPGTIAVTDDRGMYRLANLEPGDYAIGVTSTQVAVPNELMDVFFGSSGGAGERRRLEVSRELNAIGSAIVPAGSQYALAVGDHTFMLAPGTAVPQQQPGTALAVYPSVFYPAAGTIGDATAVAVRSGDERGSIDLQLHPVRTARVTGTVMAPDGPAANVGVRLIPAGANDLPTPLDVATTLTNGSGAFTFPAVPIGQFVLHVLRPPREPESTDGRHISATPGGTVTISGPPPAPGPPPPPPVPLDATLWARLPLTVGEAGLEGVIVSLAQGPRVSGRVEFEGTGEKPAGSALTGIRINLDPADGSRLGDATMAFQAGRPEEDGTFRTFGMPPGQYVLRANPPSGWSLKGAFLNGRDLSDVPFDLEAKDLSGVVLTFTDRPSSIAGHVHNGQTADPGAVVIAFPTETSAWVARGAFPRRVRTARADLEGAYTISAMVPGEYYVAAVSEAAFADLQDPALLEALIRVARQVRVLDGERRTQDLTTAVVR